MHSSKILLALVLSALCASTAFATTPVFNGAVNLTGVPSACRLGTDSSGNVANLSGCYNVKAYGAKGNGTTDDTTAFSNAIAAINTAGRGSLYVPAGTYVVDSGSLTITASNVAIFGDGISASKILNNSATGNLFTVQGQFFTFANASVDTVGGVTHTSGDQFYITGNGDDHFDHAAIASGYNGVEFNNGTAGTRFYFTNCLIAANANWGILVTAWAGNSWISNTQLNANGGGIKIANGWDGYNLSSVVVTASTTYQGLLLQPAASNSLVDVFINNSQFDTSSAADGVFIDGSASNTSVSRIFLENSWASGNGGDGLHIKATNGVVVNNLHALMNVQHGILIDTGAQYTDIEDPQASGNSSSVSGTYSGISVAPGVGWFKIRGGISGGGIFNQNNGSAGNTTTSNFANTPNTQKYGIEIQAGSSDNYQIQGVVLIPNVTGNLSDGGTGLNKRIDSNRGYDPIGYLSSQPAMPASGSSVTNPSGAVCSVYISGGTVTQVQISGHNTNLTSGLFKVPPMASITPTYSAAPTWQWFCD